MAAAGAKSATHADMAALMYPGKARGGESHRPDPTLIVQTASGPGPTDRHTPLATYALGRVPAPPVAFSSCPPFAEHEPHMRHLPADITLKTRNRDVSKKPGVHFEHMPEGPSALVAARNAQADAPLSSDKIPKGDAPDAAEMARQLSHTRTMAREAYARGHEGNGKITNHPDLA